MKCDSCGTENLEASFDGICCDCLRDYPNKRFQVWVSDLNSLYEDNSRSPALYDERINLWSAKAQANALSDSSTASWVVEKETGETVYVSGITNFK